MKINIVCSDKGWIYSQFLKALQTYSSNTILLNSKDSCDLTYCIPYYEWVNSIKHPYCAWMSHQEHRKDLYDKFLDVGKSADVAISHSKKYADLLKNAGAQNVVQIVPGVDLSAYQLRGTHRAQSNKLIVGYIGRQYVSSNRKNPALIDKIRKLPFVELKVSGGKVKAKDLPQFYAQCDLIISPSFIEGGAMCLLEGLAVGVPVVCFEGVGMAQEFDAGVIKTPFADDTKYIERIYSFYKTEEYLQYREQDTMNKMREQVKDFTWENFSKKHDEVWGNI